MAIFEREDVPAAPVNRLDEVQHDPQIRHRGLLFDLEDEAGSLYRQVDYPALFPGQESLEDLPSPLMGHHTREILGDLGLSNGEIESLVDEGVI